MANPQYVTTAFGSVNPNPPGTPIDPSKLQGADYYRYVAQNDPNPATRAAAQAWLARNSATAPNMGAGNYAPVFPQTAPAAGNTNAPVSPTPSQSDPLSAYLKSDPRFAGMDITSILNAYNTGDWSGVMKSNGQPVSTDEANAEFQRQMGVLDPAFQAENTKDKLDLTGDLGLADQNYQNYLDTSAQQFSADKDTQDKTAADNGVLFSSGRVQKLNDLKTKYDQDAALKQATLANTVAKAGRGYAYKYGTTAAQDPSLSQYFSAGSQTYNPFAAKNNTAKTGLSSIYNPGETNFYGTNPALESSQAKTRASSVLASKYNKLLPYGFTYSM